MWTSPRQFQVIPRPLLSGKKTAATKKLLWKETVKLPGSNSWSSASRSQETNGPNDPLANVPKKSRYAASPQIDAQCSSVFRDTVLAPRAHMTAKRSIQDPSGCAKEPPKRKSKPSLGFVKAARYNLQNFQATLH